MSHTTTSPSSTVDEPAAAGSARRVLQSVDWRRYVIYIGFVVVFIFFAILLGDQGFLSSNNILNIFRQSATISVIAVGMTYVISCAEIDLSVGSVAGLSSVCCAMALSHWGLVPGILAGLAVGLVVGTVNGGLVSLLGIPSFLVTLGMLGIAAGMAQWITDSAPQPILNDTFNLMFGGGNFDAEDFDAVGAHLFELTDAGAGGSLVLDAAEHGIEEKAGGGDLAGG